MPEPKKPQPAQPDPRVGQNLTGRPRRSSAGSRRKHDRKQTNPGEQRKAMS